MSATRVRLETAFAGADSPADWPPPHAAPRGDRLARPLDTLPRVGSALRTKLAKLGLETIGDLLEHRPFRYEEPVPEKLIADLFGEDEVVIVGEVQSVRERRRGRLRIVTARVADESGRIDATWFNQPWLVKQLRPGRRVRLRGRPGRYGFDVRSHDLDGVSATADFAPVYPASEDVSPKKLRELVEAALPYARDFGDGLPAELRARRALALRADSLVALHRPREADEAERARARLAFEELLVLQVAIARRAREREQTVAPSLGAPGELVRRYRDVLPFTLTPHQEAAIRQIDADLERTVPMQRLLQGDVGSGKTVVALYALLRAVENGRQGALMAP